MRRAAWLLLPVVGALTFGLVWAMRPHWRTATSAEVEAWLDPAFKEVEAPDLAAQARFERLGATMRSMDFKAKGKPYLATLTRIMNEPRSAPAEALWKQSGEGSLQRPPGGESPTYVEMSLLAQASGSAAQSLARQGDAMRSAQRFAIALWITNHMQAGTYTSEFVDPGGVGRLLRGLDKDLQGILPKLDEPALALIASRMPPTSREDSNLRRSIVANLRNDLIPVLSDPEAWAKKEDPATSPERAMDDIFLGETQDDLHVGRDTYDAEQTVRNFNRVFVPMLNNTRVGPMAYDARGETLARDLGASLPVSRASGKQGWERKWAEFQYRWELAQSRNSYGDRLLRVYGHLYASFPIYSYQSITLRESMRTRVALRRYRLKFGRPAPSLNALVQAGFLASLPIDGSGVGNLRYAPSRKRIWSVGRDFADDGGRAKRFGDFFQPDYVWETP